MQTVDFTEFETEVYVAAVASTLGIRHYNRSGRDIVRLNKIHRYEAGRRKPTLTVLSSPNDYHGRSSDAQREIVHSFAGFPNNENPPARSNDDLMAVFRLMAFSQPCTFRKLTKKEIARRNRVAV